VNAGAVAASRPIGTLANRPVANQNGHRRIVAVHHPLETATERYAREEVKLAGVNIPQGALVLAAIASANRDASQFNDADRLDITREKNRHLAFGHGTHFCLGAPLARLEGAIAIITLVRRLPYLRLAVAAGALRWRATPVLRGLEALPVGL
jgi:cytochrome P450